MDNMYLEEESGWLVSFNATSFRETAGKFEPDFPGAKGML
jgi:hypothetical protein